MADSKQKLYAITITVKPKPDGISRYSSKTFRGCTMAKTTADAKKIAIEMLLVGFRETKSPVVTIDDIIIKDCKCHDDFFIKIKE
ncbi:MAG: hypothetical protein A2066_18775 [Bacteroidetes bacterium GWB2_41_8]|nr:MAG: hypothetical protein A2066_18775 [Bacteroidetes bacterium GWB2_41_8]